LIAGPFTSARRHRSPNQYRPPTPPLGHESAVDDEDEDDGLDSCQPPVPIIDLDAALGPFQTPESPLSSNHSAKFWALTSHVGTHRRSESAPEIRGFGLSTTPTHYNNNNDINNDESRPPSRGLKRKMSVIDEDDRQSRPEDMEIDNELREMMLQEGAEMGEMGDLVIDPILHNTEKLSKRRSWRTSLREWLRKV
jgi:hypothetical protein